MKSINVLDYSTEILKGVKSGALITTKCNGNVNTMSIAWGFLGIEWNKPIFVALVRENRHTRKMLDEHEEFTINIAIEDFDKNIIKYCGEKSGNDTDKIKDLNLDLCESEVVKVPGIKQLPLTLECRVIYKKLQDSSLISQENKDRFYPQDVSSNFYGSNQDYHIAYYGEVVNAYII